jgi:hypothetical protein
MATETPQNLNETTAAPTGSGAVLLILLTASFSHLLNDTIQSLSIFLRRKFDGLS